MLRVDEENQSLLNAWLRLVGLAESAIIDGPIGGKGINVRMWPSELSVLIDLGQRFGIPTGSAAKVMRAIVRAHLAYQHYWPEAGEIDRTTLESEEWWADRVGARAVLTAQLERLEPPDLEAVVGAGLAMLDPAARRRLLCG